MVTKLEAWGDSLAIRIPKAMLHEAGISPDAELELTTDGRSITIRPARPRRPIRGRYTTEDLVRGTPEDFEPGEVDWGPPVGEEVW